MKTQTHSPPTTGNELNIYTTTTISGAGASQGSLNHDPSAVDSDMAGTSNHFGDAR